MVLLQDTLIICMIKLLCLFWVTVTFSRMLLYFSLIVFRLKFFLPFILFHWRNFLLFFYSRVPSSLGFIFLMIFLNFISLSWIITTFLRFFWFISMMLFLISFSKFLRVCFETLGYSFHLFYGQFFLACCRCLQEYYSAPYSLFLCKILSEVDCDPCLLLIFM